MQTKLSVAGILFDLDGTLVDSAPDIAHAANYTLEQLNLPAVTLDQVRTYVGNGLPKMLKRALTQDFDGQPDTGLLNQATAIFIEHYTQHVCVDSCLYPGVDDTLRNLHQRGLKLAVVTNKATLPTLPLLEQLKLSPLLSTVVCGDSCNHRKPHPAPVQLALKQLGLIASDALMMGDSAHDIGAAHSAGLPVLAVDYGYAQGADLHSLNPQAVLSEFKQINNFV